MIWMPNVVLQKSCTSIHSSKLSLSSHCYYLVPDLDKLSKDLACLKTQLFANTPKRPICYNCKIDLHWINH